MKILIALFLVASFISVQTPIYAQKTESNVAPPASFNISGGYAKHIYLKVDKLVRKKFFNPKLVESRWNLAFKDNFDAVVSSGNLNELTDRINKTLASLETSHCRLLSNNDETYHFLHSLFASFREPGKNNYAGARVFIGFVCGGSNKFAFDQVRFVLNNSPADKAGIKVGDIIKLVDGQKYIGYLNFIESKKKEHRIVVEREGKSIECTLKPSSKTVYEGYASSSLESAKVISFKNKKLGYFHLWSGGAGCQDALNDALSDKLKNTDGLILDLRDGYGANDLEDLDRFYRKRESYPDIRFTYKNGRSHIYSYSYERPIVAIINSGSRSGKEFLAYSLKKSKRAILVGETTAGAVVAGSLTELDRKKDRRFSLYLAVADVAIDGKRLEGVGVEPDIEVNLNLNKLRADGLDTQFNRARDTLSELIEKSDI